jgi:hypothetical protein
VAVILRTSGTFATTSSLIFTTRRPGTNLAKKHGVVALDHACAAALDLGVENYRFVRRYLERHPQLSLRHVDPLIRELTEYRDLINLKTKEQENEPD